MLNKSAIVKRTAVIALAVIIVVVAVLGVAAWYSTRPPPAVKEEILIGTTVAFSGPFAADSTINFRGKQLAVSLVNEKGGVYVKELDKKLPVRIIYYDDKSDPDTGVRAFERLCTVDKVDFLSAPESSTMTYPTSAVAEKYEIPCFTYAAYSERIYTRGYKWVFNVGPTVTEYMKGLPEMLAALPEKPKFLGIISADEMFARLCAEGAVAWGKTFGLRAEIIDIYPLEAKDISPSIQKVIAAGADAIFNSAHMEQDYIFVKQLNELGFRSRFKVIVVQSAAGYVGFTKDFPMDQIEGIIGTIPYHFELPSPGNDEFVKVYEEAYGIKPMWEGTGFAGVQAILSAIEAAGSLDKNKVREVCLKQRIPTAMGNLRWFENGTVAEGLALPIIQVQNTADKIEIVNPKELKTAEMQYPQPAYKP